MTARYHRINHRLGQPAPTALQAQSAALIAIRLLRQRRP
jgi:hypothetical protein